MFVTLRCQKCDNVDCPIARKYVPYESLEGCTRNVSESLAAKFRHDIEEVLPFVWKRKDSQDVFDTIESDLNEVYTAPIGCKLDMKGKKIEAKIDQELSQEDEISSIDILSL